MKLLKSEIEENKFQEIGTHLEKYHTDYSNDKETLLSRRYEEATEMLNPVVNDIFDVALEKAKKLPKNIDEYLHDSQTIVNTFSKMRDASRHCYRFLNDRKLMDKKIFNIKDEILHWFRYMYEIINMSIQQEQFETAQHSLETLSKLYGVLGEILNENYRFSYDNFDNDSPNDSDDEKFNSMHSGKFNGDHQHRTSQKSESRSSLVLSNSDTDVIFFDNDTEAHIEEDDDENMEFEQKIQNTLNENDESNVDELIQLPSRSLQQSKKPKSKSKAKPKSKRRKTNNSETKPNWSTGMSEVEIVSNSKAITEKSDFGKIVSELKRKLNDKIDETKRRYLNVQYEFRLLSKQNENQSQVSSIGKSSNSVGDDGFNKFVNNSGSGSSIYSQHYLRSPKEFDCNIKVAIVVCGLDTKEPNKKQIKKYEKCLITIENDICTKFRSIMGAINEGRNGYDPYRSSLQISYLRDVFELLPENTQQKLDEAFTQCAEIFEAKCEAENKRIIDSLNVSNEKHNKQMNIEFANTALKYYREKVGFNDIEMSNKIRQIVINRMKFMRSSINDGILSNNARIVFKILINMYEISDQFKRESSMRQLQHILDESKTEIEENVKLRVKNTISAMNTVLTDITEIALHFDYIDGLYQRYLKDKTVLGSTFHDSITKLGQHLQKFFRSLQSKFDQGFDKQDALSMAYVFDVMEVYTGTDEIADSFFSKVKTFGNVRIDKVLTLNEMIDCVQQKLNETKASILDKKIINDETMKFIEKERINYYKEISIDLTLLSNFKPLDKYFQFNSREKYFYPCIKSIKNEIKEAQQAVQQQLSQKHFTETGLKLINVYYNTLLTVDTTNLIADHDTIVVTVRRSKNKRSNKKQNNTSQKAGATSMKSKNENNKNKNNTKGTWFGWGNNNNNDGSSGDSDSDNSSSDESKSDFMSSVNRMKARPMAISGPIKNKINHKIGEIAAHCQQTSDAQELVPHLVELEMARFHLLMFKDHIKSVMENCLQHYKIAKSGGIAALASLLRKEKFSGIWGRFILDEFTMFEGEAINEFNKLMQERGIDDVLLRLRCEQGNISPSEKDAIKTQYQKFDKLYSKLVQDNLEPNFDSNQLSNAAVKIATQCKKHVKYDKSKREIKWDEKIQNGAIDLMAYSFAIWTLQNSKYYFEAGDVDDAKSYLKQPRVAQVVSIIRLLSLDEDIHSKFVRNFIEIGTGEGKSLTLAVASCVLALLGFEVNCACYSKFLSQRDYQSFEQLFVALKVENYITYGTFQELCEKVINDEINIRECVQAMILPNAPQSSRSGHSGAGTGGISGIGSKWSDLIDRFNSQFRNQRLKILLIDEVDVFFNKEFYTSSYIIGATIKHGCVKDICNYIWDAKQNDNTKHMQLKTIKSISCYQECERVFGSWMPLIDEAIKDMIYYANAFKKDDGYVVVGDKIGYKEGDRVSLNTMYGYQTLFTYFFEYCEGNISKDSLNDIVGMYFKCGGFSYAQIPSRFDVIVGVTGTLQTLPRKQKEIMEQDYNIRKYTYMPSLFAEKIFTFDKIDDIFIEAQENWFDCIISQIQSIKGNRNKTDKRPIFVFFENHSKLELFYNSDQFSLYKSDCNKLIETLNKQEKEQVIKNCCRSGAILLSTAVFGRGTDFKITEKIVKKQGGPHVIQTFLSEETSEEVQIQGRTARHGGKGSYQMILNKEKVCEKFKIDEKQLANAISVHRLYQLLDEKRCQLFEKDYNRSLQNLAFCKDRHDNSVKLQVAIKEKRIEDVQSWLIGENKGRSIEIEVKKFGILMDATGSMTDLLAHAKSRVHEMFKRIKVILTENNFDSSCFEVKFLAYRNYNAPAANLLLESNWCNDADVLESFLGQVDPDFGWGKEAIEVGFQRINDIISDEGDKISELLLIGDAGFNTDKEIQEKRKKGGNSYGGTQFERVTNTKTEIDKLKTLGIKVNTFYLKPRAKNDFEWIARETGGVCNELRINDSQQSAEALTGVVSRQVLAVHGAQLVAAYDQKYSAEKFHT